MTFYNSHGKPIAYLADEQHIFLFNGRPVAYLYDNKVYGFNGHHFGWFEDGWIRDKRGRCVFFTEDASGSGQRNQLNTRGQLNVRNMRSQQSVQNTPHVQGRRKVHLGQNYLGSSFLSSNRVKPTINIRWLVFYCEKSGGILACEPVN